MISAYSSLIHGGTNDLFVRNRDTMFSLKSAAYTFVSIIPHLAIGDYNRMEHGKAFET
jgi:hypothetical protein